MWQDAGLLIPGSSQNHQGWDVSDSEQSGMVTPMRPTNIFNVCSNLKKVGKHYSRGHALPSEAAVIEGCKRSLYKRFLRYLIKDWSIILTTGEKPVN